MLDLNELITKEAERRQEKLNHTWQSIKDYEAKILAGENVEDNLERLEIACSRNHDACEAVEDNKWEADLRKDFDLFDKMSRTLKKELGATVVEDQIIFRGIGRSLSFNLKMLAAMFNLHAGMFSFDSSFSRHEAYTETGRLIHIGISRDDEDIIVIDFHFLENN